MNELTEEGSDSLVQNKQRNQLHVLLIFLLALLSQSTGRTIALTKHRHPTFLKVLVEVFYMMGSDRRASLFYSPSTFLSTLISDKSTVTEH